MRYFNIISRILKATILVPFSILEESLKFFIPTIFLRKSVENKIILITGAGSGLGAALAISFAKLKSKLVLLDISEVGLKRTSNECEKHQSHTSIFIFQIDITNRMEVFKLSEKIKNDIGIVDILVNNAGVVSGKSLLELDEDMVHKTFNVNVISHIWIIQAFLPDMLLRNSGQIVSLASLAGLFGVNKLSDYCASKFAAVGLQESLLNELRMLKKNGIHLLTVCPFYIDTGMFEGVKSDFPFLPILQVDYVTSKITDAILTNSQVLYIPRIAYFMAILKYMLPVKGYLHLSDMVGSNRCMNDFYGRTARMKTA